VRRKGHSNVCEAQALSEQSGANVLQPVVLPDLQGKGFVRQRSLSADLIFGYFPSKGK
jgi:hypothetical protein